MNMDLSQNIFNIAECAAGSSAQIITIRLSESSASLSVVIKDDGNGQTAMSAEGNEKAQAFRLLQQSAEQTGGVIAVTARRGNEHSLDHGTDINALFMTSHKDCPPLGDLTSAFCAFVQAHPDLDLHFAHYRIAGEPVELDTREMRPIIGSVPLNSVEVLRWIRDYLNEQYAAN